MSAVVQAIDVRALVLALGAYSLLSATPNAACRGAHCRPGPRVSNGRPHSSPERSPYQAADCRAFKRFFARSVEGLQGELLTLGLIGCKAMRVGVVKKISYM
jgi:hypothetical protein